MVGLVILLAAPLFVEKGVFIGKSRLWAFCTWG